jgi:lipopolysaccharide exporter
MSKNTAQPLARRVRSGAIWSVGSTLLLRVSNIALTAITARLLSPRDFGVFAVALTAFTIISAVGELGVASCLIRADLNMNSLAPTMVTVALSTSVFLAGAMVIWAKPLATALGSSYAAGPIKVMALAVCLTGIIAVPHAQLARDFKQDKIFLANILSFFPSTAVLILLAKSGGGPMAFAWSRVVGQLVVGLVMFASLRRHFLPGMRREALSVLWRFGLPLAAANFANFILLNVDYALVGRVMGAVALGTYVLAFNVASWPSNLLGAMISSVAMPAFSRVKDDVVMLRAAIVDSLRGIALVVMPMCSMLLVVSRPLILTLYGAKWVAAADVLSVLAIYSAVSLVCSLFANILGSMGATRLLLLIQLIWLGTLVPAMVIGVHHGGIVGAAVAHIVIIVPLVLPLYLVAMKRATGTQYRQFLGAVIPALVASVIAALCALIAESMIARVSGPQVQLLVGLLAGGVVYVFVVVPQFLGMLGRSRFRRLRRNRAFQIYISAATVLGVPMPSGRHAAKRRRRRVRALGTAPAEYARRGVPAGAGRNRPDMRGQGYRA